MIFLGLRGDTGSIGLTFPIEGQKDHIKDVSFHYSHISSQYKQVWEASLTHKQKQCADSIQPEAQLQDDVVALLEKQSTNWKGLREQLKDVFFSTFDMLVHNPKSHEALKALNLAENFNRLKTEIYNLAGGEAVGDGWEWGHGEAVGLDLFALASVRME